MNISNNQAIITLLSVIILILLECLVLCLYSEHKAIKEAYKPVTYINMSNKPLTSHEQAVKSITISFNM